MSRRTEHNTKIDISVTSAHFGGLRQEWRVKRQTDCHGNALVYNYTVSQQTSRTIKDVNTSYLSSICYFSDIPT